MNLTERLQHYSQPDQSALSTADALAAARIVRAEAERADVACAVAGGLAMHLYGYARATQDVDFLASARLALPAVEALSFGGESYEVEIGGRIIRVDWIVREDFYRAFYEAALAGAVSTAEGWRVVAPEWLVILKYLAGRAKDQLDLLWLLQESGLVERGLIARHLTQVLGETGAQVALRGLEDFYVRADQMRAGDENARPERGPRR